MHAHSEELAQEYIHMFASRARCAIAALLSHRNLDSRVLKRWTKAQREELDLAAEICGYSFINQWSINVDHVLVELARLFNQNDEALSNVSHARTHIANIDIRTLPPDHPARPLEYHDADWWEDLSRQAQGAVRWSSVLVQYRKALQMDRNCRELADFHARVREQLEQDKREGNL